MWNRTGSGDGDGRTGCSEENVESKVLKFERGSEGKPSQLPRGSLFLSFFWEDDAVVIRSHSKAYSRYYEDVMLQSGHHRFLPSSVFFTLLLTGRV